jgi:hypothetical protein
MKLTSIQLSLGLSEITNKNTVFNVMQVQMVGQPICGDRNKDDRQEVAARSVCANSTSPMCLFY